MGVQRAIGVFALVSQLLNLGASVYAADGVDPAQIKLCFQKARQKLTVRLAAEAKASTETLTVKASSHYKPASPEQVGEVNEVIQRGIQLLSPYVQIPKITVSVSEHVPPGMNACINKTAIQIGYHYSSLSAENRALGGNHAVWLHELGHAGLYAMCEADAGFVAARAVAEKAFVNMKGELDKEKVALFNEIDVQENRVIENIDTRLQKNDELEYLISIDENKLSELKKKIKKETEPKLQQLREQKAKLVSRRPLLQMRRGLGPTARAEAEDLDLKLDELNAQIAEAESPPRIQIELESKIQEDKKALAELKAAEPDLNQQRQLAKEIALNKRRKIEAPYFNLADHTPILKAVHELYSDLFPAVALNNPDAVADDIRKTHLPPSEIKDPAKAQRQKDKDDARRLSVQKDSKGWSSKRPPSENPDEVIICVNGIDCHRTLGPSGAWIWKHYLENVSVPHGQT